VLSGDPPDFVQSACPLPLRREAGVQKKMTDTFLRVHEE
jgi:hypothetical protein